ncbi:flagellar export protein FliJ [Modestobacter sp. NPDC049651]|uniref:flagellar export protein FliJ n=1 Tax=unclassified Modestobacter TaxID=2643866 RepID=UPI0033D6795B
MKQARFRLEPVLRLRQTEQQAAALAAAEAARRAAAAAEHAAEQATALAARRPPASSTGAEFLAAMVASASAAADVADARAFAVAQAEQAEAVRAQWTAAAQRTKGLERLRERHLAQLQAAADAVEARTVDDLVTGQHGRARDGEEGTWRD